MGRERTIGRVVTVSNNKVTIEIDGDLKSQHKAYPTGIYPIARINSYVIIPVGSEEIVAVVTFVSMASDEIKLRPDATISLPQAKRRLTATMIGTLHRDESNKRYKFNFGITAFPSLDNPVWFILENELDAIFDKTTIEPDDNGQGYYVPVGRSTAYQGYEVKLNPDALFGKHLAILGNTGSGKSCTLTSLLQRILNYEKVNKDGEKERVVTNAHFIIFDTNGEYRSAFIKEDNSGEAVENIGDCLYIGSGQLKIPYWYLNRDDYFSLFSPSEQAQQPILSHAILFARNKIEHVGLEESCSPMPSIDAAKSYFKGIINKHNITAADQLEDKFKFVIKDRKVGDALRKYIMGDANEPSAMPPADIAQSCRLSEDDPAHFVLDDLLNKHMNQAKVISGPDSRIDQWMQTLLLRMRRYCTDPRYNFLFNNQPKDFPYGLATFLRLCFGRLEQANLEAVDSLAQEGNMFLKFYNDQHNVNHLEEENAAEKTNSGQKINDHNYRNHQVIIFDLSLIASDVLENVTAVLGRLILEFLQRIEKAYPGEESNVRGKFPIVLVLEEAHNYIPERNREEKRSVSKTVFDRIAKEGRKYGLSLIVTSQSPRDLSKMVLSQCNSFIVHRIQNPEDQAYIRKLLPSISHDLLDQLPVLAQRTALVFGDCVRAPAQVFIHEANPRPKSADPSFWKHWTGEKQFPGEEGNEPNFEKIAGIWAKQIVSDLDNNDASGDSVVSDNAIASSELEDEPPF